jgi:hypothetical protein
VNIRAGHSGGNCVDFEHTANPYRFYGLVASGCDIGIILRRAQDEALMVSLSNHDVSLTGHTDTSAYVLFDGAQFGSSLNENLYLDQQNETFICSANCYFTNAWQNCSSSMTNCGTIEIGADARTKVTQQTPVIAQFNQGLFTTAPGYDVYFDTSTTTGTQCNCRVALGGGMLDVTTQPGASRGQPTTNNTKLLTGQTSYAPPVFANAASVGVPLSLNPNELGIGVSKDAELPPNGNGLKLRVECSATLGDVKIVALAGTSTETIIKDGIGGGTVGACQ